MRAAVIHAFDGIESVTIEEVPIPEPQDHEIQIAIKCAGVNPVDWKIAEGLLKTRMPHQFPVILGWDAAGIISRIGSQVKDFKIGDPVFAYCRKEFIRDGSYAEYICVNSSSAALKPQKLTFTQAAVIPLSSLTAWQALYEALQLKKGETILIHAGAGGVGGFAIAFAHLTGSHIITTASAAKAEYVSRLGAQEVIDYTQQNFVEAILKKHPQGIDAVFDTVGGDTLKNSYRVLKEGGRLVSIAGAIDSVLASQHQVQATYHFVHPDGTQLTTIGNLIDDGKISPPPLQEVPLSEARSALRMSRSGHIQGKLALLIEN